MSRSPTQSVAPSNVGGRGHWVVRHLDDMGSHRVLLDSRERLGRDVGQQDSVD